MPLRHPIKVGEIFSRLSVIGEATPLLNAKGYKTYRVLCRCSCGEEVIVYESKLRHGTTRSCGCLQLEVSINNLPKATHGHARHDGTRSRAYACWVSMKQRCENPKSENFHRYGGRGIKVCDHWQRFENFLDDMGEPPDQLTLDRINFDGNYELSNCRWTDWETQESNRCNNRWVIINGENYTASQACRKLGINVSSIAARARRLNQNYQQVVDFYIENGIDRRGGGGRKRATRTTRLGVS